MSRADIMSNILYLARFTQLQQFAIGRSGQERQNVDSTEVSS